MSTHITTSVRLTPELRAQLEQTAHALHRGKNWIIVQALQAYFETTQYNQLAIEAKRQSLLVSHADASETRDWEKETDLTGWE